MAEQSLGLESVPFFKKPLDASESDRIVGQDDAGNFVYQTFLGNKYTVARDPDQRTTRTKIEEDVIPAVKAYAENPRLPTGEEVVGAGKAIVEGAVETASIPGDLLTGKRSPTSVQMGDAFDIAGGAAVGAGLQTLPDNAVGSMIGAFRRKDKPSTEVSFDPSKKPVQTITLGSPITPYVETMDIPKKGITGKNFLADIRKNLKVPVRVFQDDFIEGNKRYTREELLKLVEEKQFKVKAQEQGQYSGMQRQNEAGFTYGDEQEYFFMNIAATTGAGKITPRRQHASSDDIGHVRGSIITPSVSSNFDANTETIFDVVTENKPILLAEEFQSDLYQKGYKTTNLKFMQEAIEAYYGGLSKESQKIIEDSSLAANKINLPAVNDYGYIRNNTMILTDEAIERTMKDATERGYIGGDTFDSISFSVDRLKGVETDEVFKPAYLDTKRIENTVRMLAEKGVSINLPETEVFRAEMFVPPSVDVETVFKVNPLSLSNSSFIADQSTFSVADQAFLVQSMDPDTAEIFNTTTIGELNAATQEWLESLSMSAQSQGFVPSLIEDAVRNETNAERMGRGDRITADDIGGRSGGTIGDLGTISEVAENLVRKKLGLDFTETSAEDIYSSRYVNYPDNTEGYFRLINAYSDLIYEQIYFPENDTNVLGKLSATKKTDDKQIKKLEDYITKTTQGILDYRTKIVDQENEMDNHFEKFVGKLDDEEAAQLTPEQAKALRRSAIDGLREAYKGLKRNTNDFQGLDAVTPPINKVKSVTDEMLKILIVKAATSGVDKIVIPPTDRLAAVRFEDYKEYPPKFLAIMNKGLPASIQEFKKSYPEVNVSYNVEMPYDNSMYPPGSNNIPSNEGTVIDLKEFLKKYNVSPEGEVRQFAQGGLTMRDQMEMNFALGGRAETVDPVSGNDVPPGSLPVEVRDDIPARLSEGEYVVPADVVRYFGVRVFEEMRMEAKMGLQQMDADGRIGGEPIASAPSDMISDEELAQLDNMLSQKGMAAGGLAQGGMIDRLVNMARTNPVVNERIKSAGIPIEMALGGSVGVGIPSNSQNVDPKKVDEVIAKIGMAAQQNPELMRMLGERGINVPRTTAMQTPQQMQQANSPAATTNPLMNEKSITANAGGLMGYQEGGAADYISQNPVPDFNPERYRTVGKTYFEPKNYGSNFGTTPVAPAGPAAPVEPAGGCGRGMMWNGQMCIVDPNYRYEDDGGDSSGGGGTTDTSKWFEGDLGIFTNPKDYIEKQLARGKYKKEAMLATALVPGLGLASGVANKVDDLVGIANARASFEIGMANGTIDPKSSYAKSMQKELDSFGYEMIAGGNMKLNSYAKELGFDSWESSQLDKNKEKYLAADKNYLKGVTETVTTGSSGASPAPTTGGSTTEAVTINSGDDGGDNGGDNGGGGGSFGDTITGSGRTQSEIDAGAGGGGYNSSPTGRVSTSKPTSRSTVTERSDDYATGDPGMSGSSGRRGGGGGKAKGGLMAKNKEKPRNYKKGGLASRKK
tara:strand:+ start:64 stop:4560 length:4497 start_codon:yes stop_codon:yes gene_type:complete